MSAETYLSHIWFDEVVAFDMSAFRQLQSHLNGMATAMGFAAESMPEPEPAAESPYDPPPARPDARNENSPRKPWESRKWAPRGRK